LLNKNLAGGCGLYCGICEIYRAYKDSKELREELAKRHNCQPEEVRCEGCKAIDVYGWKYDNEWGVNCNILKCLNTKKLNFCYECDEYDTCKRFDQFAKICLGIGIDLRENLKKIQEGGVEEWLLEQEKRCRCPKCGNPLIVSYEFKDCHWCGNKLRE
jgi:hypothetical protein